MNKVNSSVGYQNLIFTEESEKNPWVIRKYRSRIIP